MHINVYSYVITAGFKLPWTPTRVFKSLLHDASLISPHVTDGIPLFPLPEAEMKKVMGISSVLCITAPESRWYFIQFLHLSVVSHVPAFPRQLTEGTLRVQAAVQLQFSGTEPNGIVFMLLKQIILFSMFCRSLGINNSVEINITSRILYKTCFANSDLNDGLY
jgi:hypothetical protein